LNFDSRKSDILNSTCTKLEWQNCWFDSIEKVVRNNPKLRFGIFNNRTHTIKMQLIKIFTNNWDLKNM